MKRAGALIFIIIIIAGLLSSCGNNAAEDVGEAEVFDFRSAEWGMSKARVEKSEEPNEEVYADDGTMLYEIEEDGDTLLICYFFEDDALTSADRRVEMGDELWSVRVPEMIESYENFFEYAKEFYGEPLSPDYRVWIDEDPEYVKDSDMNNLYHKRLEYLAEWDTPRTAASLRLYYQDMDFKFVFEAVSKPEA